MCESVNLWVSLVISAVAASLVVVAVYLLLEMYDKLKED